MGGPAGRGDVLEELVAGEHADLARLLAAQLDRSDGGAQRITINFEQVTVNEDFPDSLFAMPSLGAP